ncbi:hypothetical protein PP175_07215 [Aneurinibacillus sp. Ricciae_BoGa-3]|uniref:hypothetical protein n=1 Tax=Aneurinibacillus sp. Ricciae_BoGa-3 TaxID=3022697 RepID=UPI00233FBFC5|nr:hypothetical protein [Aneurinibacillus sp. Ricciae_BoGa-3]WCK55724.1 hypothetical protein PP175_07215 [Aneurinibacillus sp. Ricciae_BoGa-3]
MINNEILAADIDAVLDRLSAPSIAEENDYSKQPKRPRFSPDLAKLSGIYTSKEGCCDIPYFIPLTGSLVE